MNIIVVGCGKIGITILDSLVKEGHDLVAVDNDPAIVTEITNIYDVIGVCGNGADSDTLTEAGVEKAELFVAVTDSDELNMLSCYIARCMGAKHTIARVRNPEYNDQSLGFMKQQLGLSMTINPELMAAHEFFNILKLPSAVKIETFARRNFEMVELILKNDSPLNGVRLMDLRKKYNKCNFLICVVQRGDEVYIPDGNFELKSGDRIGLTANHTEIQRLLKMLGMLKKQARDVILLGASRTAYYLAKMLIGSGNSVKVIEKDRDRCTEFCEVLPEAVVIQGDGALQELLLEEGIRSTDAFVALTGMDEENILISFYAMSQNVPKVISKVNRDELSSMAEKLGLDSIVSPQKTISDVLVRYARALKNSIGSEVEALYNIMDGKAEALEFNVLPNFPLLQTPLKDMQLKSNILIAGIIRGRKAIIPTGLDMILPGDRVVVIAANQHLQDLSDIIQ